LTSALAFVACCVGCAPAAPTPSEPAAAADQAAREGLEVRGPARPAEPSTSELGEAPALAPTRVEPAPTRPKIDVPSPAYLLADEVSPGVRRFVEARREAGAAGSVWAGPLAGNGGRDVVIYVPPTVDPEARVRPVFHFHGTYSEHLEPEAAGVAKKKWVGWNRLDQTLAAADALAQAHEQNVVVIYPISAGRRIEPEWVGWSNKQYDRLWMKAESFAQLHRDVLGVLERELGIPATALDDRLVAEGHSAGGIALWNIAAGGRDRGAGLVTDYLFLDASFQDWADGCHAAIERHGLDARLTMVITDQGIADAWAGRSPWCTEAPEHAAAWPRYRAECEPLLTKKPNTKPAGSDVSCRVLAADAESWPRQRAWCEAMQTDMKGVRGVFVHRTKVPHGQQIEHFLGGLELPDDWWID